MSDKLLQLVIELSTTLASPVNDKLMKLIGHTKRVPTESIGALWFIKRDS